MEAMRKYQMFYLFLFIIMVCLQVFLSKRKDKFAGLVLPIISFFRSLSTIFSYWIQDYMDIENLFYIILVNSIPTIILMLIYFFNRKKIKRDEEIEKMNIQDL